MQFISQGGAHYVMYGNSVYHTCDQNPKHPDQLHYAMHSRRNSQAIYTGNKPNELNHRGTEARKHSVKIPMDRL